MNLPEPKKINAQKYEAGLSIFKNKAAKIKLSAKFYFIKNSVEETK